MRLFHGKWRTSPPESRQDLPVPDVDSETIVLLECFHRPGSDLDYKHCFTKSFDPVRTTLDSLFLVNGNSIQPLFSSGKTGLGPSEFTVGR